MNVHLAAVQAAIEPQWYQTDEAFLARVDRLAHLAAASAPDDATPVIAFPELFALPLLFWHRAPEAALKAQSALEASWIWLKSEKAAALRSIHHGPWFFYHWRANRLWPLYVRAFREAARKYRAYVLAGSLIAPRMDEEPARGMYAVSSKVYNQALWINPEGRILARPEKIRLMPEERRALVAPGAWGGQVVHTRIGVLGVLICLDAFHEALVERVDASGAWLLVQPSANPAKWEGPWKPDPKRREGEVWLAEGLRKKLEDRENLRYGLNPMLTGQFYETAFEGRANVAAAGETLAITPAPTGDGLASFTVTREG